MILKLLAGIGLVGLFVIWIYFVAIVSGVILGDREP